MINIPFIYIPITALCCYIFLLLAFMAAKKNSIIRSFMVLLVAFAVWTAGSLFMRMQLYPGVDFWYEFSIAGLFSIPLFLYNFVYAFVGAKGYVLKTIWSVSTVIIIVANYFNTFLQHPQILDLGDGQASFVYTMEWTVIFPILFSLAVLISSVRLVVKEIRNNEMSASCMVPILIGMSILLLGNILDVVPAIGRFPGDTLSGIVNAGFMFYALYRKHLFKLSLLVSKGTILMISAAIASICFTYLLGPFERMLLSRYPQAASYKTLIIALCFSLVIVLFYWLIQSLIENVFIKEEQVQAGQIKDFSFKVSKSLDLGEILDELVCVVKSSIDVQKVYVCLIDESGENYEAVRSASPLDPKGFSICRANPCVTWLEAHNSCLMLDEFEGTTLYRSMWEGEKRQLKDLGIECMVPLKCDERLVGMLLLSGKNRKGSYNYDDVTFLESVDSIASIAIDNANLYSKAYYEARMDSLTGLLNRKYFYERLEEEFERARGSSLALIILNLDDFKLYNQLYGNREGDVALQKVSGIISNSIGDNGFCSRYGGKEFAIALPHYDTLSALRLAEEIKQKVMEMNREPGYDGGTLRVITLSGGICVYPYAASNVKQLIDNADMAVYNAKRSGKNKVVAYFLERPTEVTGNVLSMVKPGTYEEYAPTIYALTAAIDAKDHYTFNHSQNVADYSMALAEAIGLNREHVQMIYEAGLLHDIGKISIPERILSKPGELTKEEYKVMQTHVENSIAMIRHLPSLDYVIPAAIGHHERWDGKGYPRGIGGEDIPISARCLAIADAFDAMVSKRSYKEPMSVEFALNELERQSGKQFAPHLTEVFVDLVRSGRLKVKSEVA